MGTGLTRGKNRLAGLVGRTAIAALALGGLALASSQAQAPTFAETLRSEDVDERWRINPPEPVDQLSQETRTASPGVDTCLAMSWEPTVAVDPNNPMIVAAAQFLTVQISLDGGDSFTQTLNATVPMGFNGGGDPSLAFDSRGRLFFTYLCATTSGRDVCMTGFEQDPSLGQFVPVSGTSWPVNVTALAGHGAFNADKEWLAADSFRASTFADRLYVVWTDLDQWPWEVWITSSGDQGKSWSAAQKLSVPDEGLEPWPVHNTVAPNGDVYVAYHSQLGFLDPNDFFPQVPDGISGQIVVRRSGNGGATWGPRSFAYLPGEADMTWNVQHKSNGVIPGARFWLFGSLQPWILADPFQVGRIYVVANDDPDNDVDAGDAADVFIVISDDHGQSWSEPIRVDDGAAGILQVMPTAAIDPVTGAIAVTFYDNGQGMRNGSGNFLLDLLATSSLDGGLSWSPEIDVNDGLFDPDRTTSCRFCCGPSSSCFGQPITTRIGEYNGVAYDECTAHMVWADNESCGSGGSMLDTFYDRAPLCVPEPDAGTLGATALLTIASLHRFFGKISQSRKQRELVASPSRHAAR